MKASICSSGVHPPLLFADREEAEQHCRGKLSPCVFGVDVPPEVLEQLLAMRDEENSGALT